MVINLIFLQKMAIFWPKKWSQGPEKKKKFFHFFICETPRRKKPPFYFFDFLFFCRFFGEKCQFFRVFSAKKAPSGRFMSTPPGPTGVPYRFKPKKWSKMDFLFLCPHSTHSVLMMLWNSDNPGLVTIIIILHNLSKSSFHNVSLG